MSYFLRQFAGFLIQIGASVFLSLIPFAEEDYRYPRKEVLVGCGSFTVLVSACFPYVRTLVFFWPSLHPTLLANLYMLLAVVAFMIFYFFVIRAETVKKLVVLLLVIFYAATQYLLVNLISPMFPNGTLPDTYPPLILALYAGTAVVMFPVSVLVMKKIVGDYLKEMELRNIRREFSIVLTITMLYFILLVIYSSCSSLIVGTFWWWVTPPFLLAAAILCIFYWTLFRESVRRKRDSEQQKALQIKRIQYETISREMENARRMRHDMRHYLAGMYDMLEQGRAEEMKTYLTDIMDSVSKRDSEIYCRNATVNGLLQYYVGMAKNENIRCEVRADCDDLTISPADLTVLLGNAMENAIHACMKIPEKRWIKVQVGVMGGSLVVQIINPCKGIHPSGRYHMDGGFLPAAAFLSGREGGGYGLSSIEHTAKKYGGDARFQYDSNEMIFTTRIRLNLHPEML